MADFNDIVEADEVVLAGGSEDYVFPSDMRGFKMVGRASNANPVEFRISASDPAMDIPETEWVDIFDRNFAGRTIVLAGTAADIIDILILKGSGA